MADFEVTIEGLDEFIRKLRSAADGDFKKQLAVWLEAMGFEFLDIIQDEIIRKKVVDTRLLLNSFTKGEKGNIWTVKYGGLRLDIGTNLKYAEYVNDGHWTNPKGVEVRWVPGVWNGGKFEYQKGNRETGMLLRQQWIDGTHYWESALKIFEKIFATSLERNLQHWLDNYF